MAARQERSLGSARELVLSDLVLAPADPALAAMRDDGLFADLAGHHARQHGETVHGAVHAEWIGPNTVRINYHAHQPAEAPRRRRASASTTALTTP